MWIKCVFMLSSRLCFSHFCDWKCIHIILFVINNMGILYDNFWYQNSTHVRFWDSKFKFILCYRFWLIIEFARVSMLLFHYSLSQIAIFFMNKTFVHPFVFWKKFSFILELNVLTLIASLWTKKVRRSWLWLKLGGN